jgi:hypothetical protein
MAVPGGNHIGGDACRAGEETVWRTGKDIDFRVLSGIDYR